MKLAGSSEERRVVGRRAIGALSLPLLWGCSSEGAVAAQADVKEKTSVDERCNVVSVNASINDDLFEEGLGSEYDIDDEGYARADSDSTVAGVAIDKKEKTIRVGQMEIPIVEVGKRTGAAVYTARDESAAVTARTAGRRRRRPADVVSAAAVVHVARVPEPSLPFSTRLWFAWSCFFRVLFQADFAASAFRLARGAEPERLPPAPEPAKQAVDEPPSVTPALQLLALLQREGRLVDFLEQDIAKFGDAEIGAVARVVHDGCRKALRDHLSLAPLRSEDEGAKVTLEEGFSAAEIKLTGNVRGSAPYEGVLRHRGWRAEELKLPRPMKGHDAHVLAPAEVEL